MLSRCLLLGSLLLVACGPARRSDDGGPTGPTCHDGEVNGEETDVDCGGTCSPCANGKACAAPTGCASGECIATICARSETCAAEDDEAFCARLEKTCGQASAVDNCGDARSVDCGTCQQQPVCSGASTSGVPGTTPLQTLTQVQRTMLCNFTACAWGGYGQQVTCSDDSTFSGPESLEDCVDEVSTCASAAVTVANAEACQARLVAEPCNAFEILLSSTECAAMRSCVQ